MKKFNKSTSAIFVLLVLAVLSVNVYALSGSGTEADPWLIQSLSDFNDFVADANYWDDYTRLGVDIDWTGIYTAAPIAPDTDNSTPGFQGTKFTGSFDGDGHTMFCFGINTTENDYLGLFGYIDSGAEVKNLGIEGCSIYGGTGSEKCGGLAGYNHGTISECYMKGIVTGNTHLGGLIGYDSHGVISECYAMVSIGGDGWLGGLVGYLYYGSIDKSYSTGSVNGYDNLGGLAGYLYYGSVSNSYSTGSVTGDNNIGGLAGFSYHGDIDDCYSAGSVSGNTNVGGLVGDENTGTADNCFWDTETSGQSTSAGGTGKTTIEMQTASTFTDAGWDFVGETANGTDNIWTIDEGNDYPRHWQGTLSGSGSEASPFLIESQDDFEEFSSNDFYWVSGLYTSLETNINLASITYTTAVIAPDTNNLEYDFQGVAFRGSFDGNGYGIFNLTIDTAGADNDFLSLFGEIDSGAIIKNLNIINCNITGGNHSEQIGSLAGYLYYGSVSNSYSTGSVSGCKRVGGLCGVNNGGNINNCYSTSSVIGVNFSRYLGGLIGMIGEEAEISNCYSTGAVSGYQNVGGLIGYEDTSYVNDVNGCFWDINTSGRISSAGGTGKTTTEMKTVNTFFNAGWNFIAVWNIEDGQIYPLLRKYLAVDTNYDNNINFADFADFASHWLEGAE